jgi:RNA-directed DNA polymerase
LDSSLGESPHPDPEETAQGQTLTSLSTRPGKQKGHSLIDKVYSWKNLAVAWEPGKQNHGSAGIDDVTIAQCERRQASYLALGHRKVREGT